MIPPPYASLVLLELLKNETSGGYFVRVGFKNTTGDPYLLTLPGCQPLCSMADFIKITKPIVPEDWVAECQKQGFVQFLGGSFLGRILFKKTKINHDAGPSAKYFYFNHAGLATGGFLAVMLVFVIPIMACIRYRRGAREPPKYPYLHLQMDDEEA